MLSERDYIPQLSIDCVIFGFHENKLKVLLPKFSFVEKLWALPGGYIQQNESIDQAATRLLEERTGLKNIYLEQFKVFGDVARTHLKHMNKIVSALRLSKKSEAWISKRFITIGYFALVDYLKVIPQSSDLDESCEWYDIQALPQLAFDHKQIIASALTCLRMMLEPKLIGFKLLPKTFTIGDIQAVYESILSKSLSRNNFQKKILDLGVLIRLDKKYTGGSHKAPYLYRLKNSKIK